MKKALVFEKLAARKLVLQNVKDNADYAKKRVLTEGRVKSGWRAHVTEVVEAPVDVTVETGKLKEDGTPETQHKTQSYTFELHVEQKSKRLRREDVVAGELEKIIDLSGKSLKAKGWVVKEVKDLSEDYCLPGYPVEAEEPEEAPEAHTEEVVVEVPDVEVPASVNEPVAV